MKELRYLLLIIAGLIIYGSLYPFNFTPDAIHRVSHLAHLFDDPFSNSRSNILSNIVLFVPFGLVGMQYQRFTRLYIYGLLVATFCQIAQLYLPSRVPAMDDIFWNGVGLLIGCLVGTIPLARIWQHWQHNKAITLYPLPLALILAWLSYRMVPFVPSIDWQLVKDSIKPIFYHPIPEPLSLFRLSLAWLLVFQFWRDSHTSAYRDWFIVLLIPSTYFFEIFIVSNYLSSSNVFGAVIAITLWFSIFRYLDRRPLYFLIALATLLCLEGLAPFQLRSHEIAFNWIPFSGALSGSIVFNISVMCEKVFFYGSLIYLLRKNQFSWITIMLVSTGLLGIIEYLQCYFTRHTPEITDPLIALILTGVIKKYYTLSTNSRQLNST